MMRKLKPMPLIKIDLAIQDGLYVATSEDLPGLFVADRNIIDLFSEIPEVIKAIHKELFKNKNNTVRLKLLTK